MPYCDVIGASKPVVWKDEDEGGWRCDQWVKCRKCMSAFYKDYNDGKGTWAEAMEASKKALPVEKSSK